MTLLLLLLTLAAAYAARHTLAWLATLGPRLRRPALTAAGVALAAQHWPTAAALTALTLGAIAVAAAITLARMNRPHPTTPQTEPADLDTAIP